MHEDSLFHTTLKRLLVIVVLLSIGHTSYAQNLTDGWRYLASMEKPQDASIFGTGAWKSASLPIEVDFEATQGRSWWFSKEISQAHTPDATHRYLFLGAASALMEVYFNDSLVFKNGRESPELLYRFGQQVWAFVPEGLWRENQSNYLLIRLYREGGSAILPVFHWGDELTLTEVDGLVNFLNIDLYGVFAFINFFIFLFFLLQYFYNLKERQTLLLALSNLFFGFFFLRFAYTLDYLPFHLTFNFCQASSALAIGFLTWFFIENFKVFDKLWLKLLIMANSLFFFVYILLAPTVAAGEPRLFLSLIPDQLEIFLILTISIIALKKSRQKEIWITLIGTLWGVGWATHDMIAEFLNLDILVWMQGIGTFGFNFSVFVLIAVRNIKTQKALAASEGAMRQQELRLKENLGAIAEMTLEVVGISHELNQAIIESSATAASIRTETDTIQQSLSQEYVAASGAQKSVKNLSRAVGQIQMQVMAQEKRVKTTFDAIAKMLEELESSSDKLGRTSEFTRKLDSLVREAQSSVLSSREAMDNIRTLSQTINDIVRAVTDLAEQTNLLSMNAAIEAAHAGETGKGFAVVANEIQRLASGSAERSQEINGRIGEIQGSIEQGSEVSEATEVILEKITKDSKEAMDQVESLYEISQNQKSSSLTIRGELRSLSEASEDIRVQADNQNQSTQSLERDMEDLVGELASIKESAGKIGGQIESFIGTSHRIAGIHKLNLELISRLQSLASKQS